MSTIGRQIEDQKENLIRYKQADTSLDDFLDNYDLLDNLNEKERKLWEYAYENCENNWELVLLKLEMEESKHKIDNISSQKSENFMLGSNYTLDDDALLIKTIAQLEARTQPLPGGQISSSKVQNENTVVEKATKLDNSQVHVKILIHTEPAFSM